MDKNAFLISFPKYPVPGKNLRRRWRESWTKNWKNPGLNLPRATSDAIISKMQDETTEIFLQAASDYFFLLNRDFPGKETIKLVGDRYRLTGSQRNMLFRGVTAATHSQERKTRRISHPGSKHLYIDGYNVLFTVMNYFLGKPLFIGNDGFLRDSGEIYGRIANSDIFNKAIHMVIKYLVMNEMEPFTFVLDQPVPGSSDHVVIIENHIHELAKSKKNQVLLTAGTDHYLMKVAGGVIATSDSEIIDRAVCPLLDLARKLLNDHNHIDNRVFNLEWLG